MFYMILMFLTMGLGALAQSRVKGAYAKASQIPSASGISGKDAAQAILDAKGIENVGIEMVQGVMSDHYDPKAKMLRLSPDVYQGNSLASVGIAAHEVGHAIQDATNYGALVMRNGIVPFASKGSQISGMLMMVGAVMRSTPILIAAVALFSLNVIFQLVNLPVEFNASSRAKTTLLENNIINQEEHKEVDRVLDAAALTYVAATISAVAGLVFYLFRLGLIGGRR